MIAIIENFDVKDLFESSEEHRALYEFLNDSANTDEIEVVPYARTASQLMFTWVLDLFEQKHIEFTFGNHLLTAMAKCLSRGLQATRQKPDGNLIQHEYDRFYCYFRCKETGTLHNLRRSRRSSIKEKEKRAASEEPAEGFSQKKSRLDATIISKTIQVKLKKAVVTLDTKAVDRIPVTKANMMIHFKFCQSQLIVNKTRIKGDAWGNYQGLFHYSTMN